MRKKKKFKSKEGQRLFDETVQAFELDEHDLQILEQACDTADRIASCQAFLARSGNFIKDRYGSIKVCPALRELTQLKIVFSRQIRELKLEETAAQDIRIPRLVRKA